MPALAPHPAALKAAQEAEQHENADHGPELLYVQGRSNLTILDSACKQLTWLLPLQTAQPNVIYTNDPEKPYQDFKPESLSSCDERLQIYFDNPQCYEEVMILLRFNCPDAECDVACPEGWGELKRHIQKTHGKQLWADHFCCLDPECLEKKFQVFDSEIDLKAHEIQVHPNKRTMRGKGEKIELNFQYVGGPSRRGRGGGNSQASGSGRGRGAPAETPAQAQPAPATASESTPQRQLRAPPGFGSQLSTLPVETPDQPDESRDVEEVPAANPPRNALWPALNGQSTARNDKNFPTLAAGAAQRNSNFPSMGGRGPSVSKEDFPSITASNPARGNSPSSAPSSSVSSSSSGSDSELVKKIKKLFGDNQSKLGEFKSLATSFKTSLITSDEFLTSFMSLALDDKKSEQSRREATFEAGKLWTQLAETVPEESGNVPTSQKQKKKAMNTPGKKEQMLRAWNDYKVQNAPSESVPVRDNSYAGNASRLGLVPATAQYASAGPNAPSARILVIKSNASKQRHAGWNSASSGRGYVSLSGPSRQNSTDSAATFLPSSPTPAASTLAVSESVIPAAQAPVTPHVVAYSTAGSSSGVLKKQDFPGLPKASRPSYPMAKKTSTPEAWGASSSEPAEESEPAQGKGKKNKKGKQVLMYVG
ncbi:hypothetical protein HDV05_003751 [Chytridiales sp. JEL 0842]|nr:hypothetical protein HDV05_003751 [Chytridiales sp. JEL 0842]